MRLQGTSSGWPSSLSWQFTRPMKHEIEAFPIDDWVDRAQGRDLTAAKSRVQSKRRRWSGSVMDAGNKSASALTRYGEKPVHRMFSGALACRQRRRAGSTPTKRADLIPDRQRTDWSALAITRSSLGPNDRQKKEPRGDCQD